MHLHKYLSIIGFEYSILLYFKLQDGRKKLRFLLNYSCEKRARIMLKTYVHALFFLHLSNNGKDVFKWFI